MKSKSNTKLILPPVGGLMYIFVLIKGLFFYGRIHVGEGVQEFVLYWQGYICGNSTTRLLITCRIPDGLIRKTMKALVM